MKKLLLSCVLAVACVLSVGAQDMKTWEGKLFSIAYPTGGSVEDMDADAEPGMIGVLFAASANDDELTINATYNVAGPTVGQLGEYANNLHFMHSGSFSDWTCDKPVVKGNKLTMRKVTKDDPEDPEKEKFVEWDFAVIGSGTKGVAGTIKAPLAKEAEYAKYLEPIVNSVVIK